MKEKYIESRLVSEVKKIGGLCLKLNSQSSNGVPDRIVLLPKGAVYFIELKSPGEKLRPLQYYWWGILNKLGFEFLKIDNIEEVDVFIRSVKRGDNTND